MNTTEVFIAKHVPNDAEVTPECFGIREVPVPLQLPEGGLLLKTLFIGLEPWMRAFGMKGMFGLDKPPSTKIVGEVLESKSPRFSVGDKVKCSAGWRSITWVVVDDTLVEALDASVPPQLFLGLAGSGGRSASLPLKHIARPSAGQTAFVTAASSCVGLCAAQLMTLDGVKVAGSCGSAEKVELLSTLGVTAFNYRTESIADGVKRTCPDGVDFLFDNVDGAIRLAVLEAMNPGGVIINCGRMCKYDAAGGEAGGDEQREVALKKAKGIAEHGTNVNTWEGEFLQCTAEIVDLYQQGKLVDRDTVVEGLANLPKAFVGIFRGENVGRMLVKVA